MITRLEAQGKSSRDLLRYLGGLAEFKLKGDPKERPWAYSRYIQDEQIVTDVLLERLEWAERIQADYERVKRQNDILVGALNRAMGILDERGKE